jgi:hypothetical protein
MRRHLTVAAACAAAGLIIVAGSRITSHAQTQAPAISGQTPVPTGAPTGPAPRLPNGKPDFSGVWQRPYVPDMSRNGRGQAGYAEAPFAPNDPPAKRDELHKAGNFGELPFTSAGLDDWKTYDPTNGDYTGSCLPFGMSRSMNSPDPVQIMQNDKYVALMFEQNSWFHVVHLNADHPKNVEPTWFGQSVGKWDGDTLVIDTVGFNGNTRLDTIGHPHSDGLHMIQTLKRTDAGHIAYTVTIDDPKAYTKPWKNERTWTLMNTEILEYSCEENNKDLQGGHIKFWTPPARPKYPPTVVR